MMAMMNKENTIMFLGDVAAYAPYKFHNKVRAIANLECPITKNGSPATGKIILGAGENHLQSIFNNTLLGVNLANNHILDYGEMGLSSTINSLEEEGIGYFGLNNLADNNPAIIKIGTQKYALISAICESTSPVFGYNNTNCLSSLEPDEIISKAKVARKRADRVIVFIHWGIEESSYPLKKDVLTARKLIDGGVDIVIGSHAHAPQPVERYKNGIIAYNLGNFIMPEMKNIPSYFDENGIPHSSFTGKFMLWNRISWGLLVDMSTMDFRVRKFMFTRKRVIELPFSPLDGYLKLPCDISDDRYDLIIEKHLRRRKFLRKISEFLSNPHIPQILKRIP
jgi:hypothetical protein